jgi:membrane-bound ClpP family serine protease
MATKRSYPRTQNLLLLLQIGGDTLFAFLGLMLAYWLRFDSAFNQVGVIPGDTRLRDYLPLLVIGTVALALEVKLPTHGVLGGAGVLAIVLGSLLLVDQSDYFGGAPHLKPIYAVPVIAAVAVQLLLVARGARKAMAAPLLTGIEAMVGRVGEARSDFGGDSPSGPEGVVFVDGARWTALCDGPAISAGEAVTVVSVSRQPTRLRVQRVI